MHTLGAEALKMSCFVNGCTAGGAAGAENFEVLIKSKSLIKESWEPRVKNAVQPWLCNISCNIFSPQATKKTIKYKEM